MLLLLLPILFGGCFIEKERAVFEREVLKALPTSLEITGISSRLNLDEPLTRPPGTWINLLESTNIDGNGDEQFYCLFYKMPGVDSDSSGTLRFITSLKSCFEDFKSGNEVDWTDIEALKFWKPEVDKKIFNNLLKRGHLYLMGKHQKEDFLMEIPLFNIKFQEKPRRFSNSLQSNIYRGSFLYKPVSSRKTFGVNGLLGKYGDNYRDKTSVLCHEFSKDCIESMSFKCDQCKFGWYSAVGLSTCPGQTIKFCGLNKCGERGMPACPRGIESAKRIQKDLTMYCYDGSPAGYCQSGLKTVCDGTALICL